MKKSLILISSALLLIAGCAKEQLVDLAVQNGYDGPVTIVGATYEQFATEGETKASFNENGTFGWETAESAKFETTNGWYESTAQDISADKSKCSFQIVGDLSTDMVAVLPADINPARYDAQSTNDGLKVTIPASRTWVKDQSYATMLGFGANNGGNTSYSFSHLGGLAKIKVNGVPTNATKFVFKTKGYKINGEFKAGKINTSGGQTISTAAASSAATSVDDFTEDEETYTLTFASNDISSNGGVMEFNVPLPCGTYSNGFAFCFKNESGGVIYSFVGSSPQTVGRTDRLCLPTINIVGGGGENLPTKSVQNIPAGYKGDFLLAEAENVLLKIAPEANANDINIKYNSGQKPSNLEINIVDGETAGTFAGTISGNLPDTHVDFTKGTIANVSMTTSTSTFEIIYPATISTKLTVTGGNVKVKGAQVAAIEVAENAVASDETKAPVEIVVEKSSSEETFTAPAVTANANVIVAPASGVSVNVTANGDAKVANTGEGDVSGTPLTTAQARIDDINYFTLADAVKAAPTNATAPTTITLLENVTDGAGIFLAATDKKNIIIYLNDKAYTAKSPAVGSEGYKTQAFHFEKDNTVVIKNGKINIHADNKDKTWSKGSEDKGIAMIIQNYANLTLEDMTIDATNIAQKGTASTEQVRYAVSTNHGSTTFAGKTEIITVGDDIAFDSCDGTDVDYPGKPTVTWSCSDEGSVTGGIELSGGIFVVETNLSVSAPVLAAEGESTLEIGEGATLSPATNFSDPNPNISNHATGTAPVQVKRGASLTICGDGVVDSKTVASAVIVTVKGDDSSKTAKLTVNGKVTLQGKYYGISGNGDRQNTEITVKGGNIKGTEANNCAGIYHPQSGSLNISGGTIEGAVGIYVKAGTVSTSVEGGEIKGTGIKKDYSTQGGGFVATGDAIVFDNCDYPGGVPNATIYGGTFTSENGLAVASYAKEGVEGGPIKPVIYGGTFSDESALKYAAKNANITIKLQADRTQGTGVFVKPDQKQTITFDLNGYDYVGVGPAVGSTGTSNQLFHIEKGNTFILKNSVSNQGGTVSIASEKANLFRFIIQNYADLTLENVTIDGTGLSYKTDGKSYTYALSNNCGTVNLNGTTSIKASTTSGMNNYAFDVCKYASYDAPTVTWNSTGSVDGTIELSGGNFVLGHNLEVKQPVKVIAPATLNLDNYTLSAASGFTRGTAGVIIVNRKGHLTVKGNANGAVNANNNVYAAVLMTEKDVDTGNTTDPATLTVESGSLIGQQYGITGNGSNGRGNTVITIKGGTVKGTKSDDCAGIYHPQEGTLAINGGTIEGAVGIYVKAGSVTTAVDGGTIKGVGAKDNYSPCTNGFHPTGDAIVFDNCGYPGGEPNATINGGNFISTNGLAIASYATGSYSPISPVINGGTFSDLYGIVYAASGATYKLGNDVAKARGIKIPAGKNFTVDFQNHKYAVECPGAGSSATQTQGFQINSTPSAKSTITFKNGTIECTKANKNATWQSDSPSKGIAMLIQDYADLTLENMTIDGTNIAHNGNNVRYILSSNYGDITLKGNTSIIAPEGDFAFDAYDNKAENDSSYPNAPTVTWNSTGSVTGNIELAGGKLVIASDLVYANTILATAGTSNLEVNATLSATDVSDWYLVKAGKEGKSGVVLNISGTGTLSSGTSEHCIPVTSDYGAQVNISGGNYECYGVNTNTPEGGECVYANREGKVSILGGEFSVRESDTVKDLLNVQNNQKVTDIQCTGGTFYGKNPADGDDAIGGSFVAEGYEAKEASTGVWTVSEQN